MPEPGEWEKRSSGHKALKDRDKKSEKQVRDMLRLISDMLPTLQEIQEEKRTRAEEDDTGLDFCQAEVGGRGRGRAGGGRASQSGAGMEYN